MILRYIGTCQKKRGFVSISCERNSFQISRRIWMKFTESLSSYDFVHIVQGLGFVAMSSVLIDKQSYQYKPASSTAKNIMVDG